VRGSGLLRGSSPSQWRDRAGLAPDFPILAPRFQSNGKGTLFRIIQFSKTKVQVNPQTKKKPRYSPLLPGGDLRGPHYHPGFDSPQFSIRVSTRQSFYTTEPVKNPSTSSKKFQHVRPQDLPQTLRPRVTGTPLIWWWRSSSRAPPNGTGRSKERLESKVLPGLQADLDQIF
jgi:hypothetical protein